MLVFFEFTQRLFIVLCPGTAAGATCGDFHEIIQKRPVTQSFPKNDPGRGPIILFYKEVGKKTEKFFSFFLSWCSGTVISDHDKTISFRQLQHNLWRLLAGSWCLKRQTVAGRRPAESIRGSKVLHWRVMHRLIWKNRQANQCMIPLCGDLS